MLVKLRLLLFFLCLFSYAKAINIEDFLKEKTEINRNDFFYHFVLEHQKDEIQLTNAKNFVTKNGTEADKLYLDFYIENSKGDVNKQGDLIEKYLAIAKKEENWFFVSTLYMYKAFFLRVKKEFALALENYLYAYDESVKDKTGNYYHNSFMFQQMGLAFLEFNDYEKALKFGLICHQTNYFNDPNKASNWLPKATANLIGVAYTKLNKPDSALFWFKRCYSISSEKSDSVWKGIALGSIAEIYANKKEYAKALDLYLQSKALHKGSDNQLIDYNINTYADLANVYLALGNNDAANKSLKIAASFLPKKEFSNNALKYYTNLVAYYKQTQASTTLLLNATDSLQHYHAIVDKEFNEKQKISVEATIAYNKQFQQTQIAQANFKNTQLTLFASIGLLILLILISILYTKRKNLRHKLQQQQLETENKIAAQELLAAQQELNNFTKRIQEKNELLEQFTLEIEELQILTNKKEGEKTEALNKLKQAVILTNDDWDNYKELFDKAYPNFSNKLKEKHPTITQAEIRYLMFSKLNLSNKEMAASLGIGLEGIRSLKHRVKQKLNEDFEAFMVEN
ncbi:MAG: hypothetical protein ACOVMM_11265 [Chitinophagaceae bacterium]